jgi:coproporphyrinogen III oxidase-like Fe-S oxidoreductase
MTDSQKSNTVNIAMMCRMAKGMLSKSFARIKFNFGEADWGEMKSSKFGLYIHVPFCKRLCAFCPFYKVLYKEDLKEAYLEGILKEIRMRGLEGKAEWLYMGGGTPNLLRPEEIGQILSTLRNYVKLENVGMEGNPAQFTTDYLKKIKDVGMNKISMGIESLKPETLEKINRDKTDESRIREITECAKDLGLSVNVDLMVGLPGQKRDDFLSDVKRLAEIGPQQITTYPFLVIPGVHVRPEISSKEMFDTIESAGIILREHGYDRDSIWIFSKNRNIYDSSGDELVVDYLGFGPASFSKVGKVQMVNPPLEIYLDMIAKEKPLAFRTEVDEKADVWRRFAHELYNLKLDERVIKDMPISVKSVLLLLKLTGNVKGVKISDKGRLFVHEITKTVVESLPFPLSDNNAIENLDEYVKTLKTEQSVEESRTAMLQRMK